MAGISSSAISAAFSAPRPRPRPSDAATVSATGMSGYALDKRATTIPVSAMLAAIDRSMPRVISASICASAMIATMAPSVTRVSRLPALRNTGARTAIAPTSTTMMIASTASRRRSRLHIGTLARRKAEPGGRGNNGGGVELGAQDHPDDPALVHHHDAVGDPHELGQLR